MSSFTPRSSQPPRRPLRTPVRAPALPPHRSPGQRGHRREPPLRRAAAEPSIRSPADPGNGLSGLAPSTSLVVERMLAGAAARRHGDVAEVVGREARSKSLSTSEIPRRFVRATESALAELMARSLADLEVGVLMIDGLTVAASCVAVVTVITTAGTRLPVGLWLGDTENETGVTACCPISSPGDCRARRGHSSPLPPGVLARSSTHKWGAVPRNSQGPGHSGGVEWSGSGAGDGNVACQSDGTTPLPGAWDHLGPPPPAVVMIPAGPGAVNSAGVPGGSAGPRPAADRASASLACDRTRPL